eukprot:g17688.t1
MKCSAYYLEGWGRPRETPALVHEALWKKTDGKPITGDIYPTGGSQSKMWGFDSFKGLPKEDGSEQYLQKRFYVGAYKAEDTPAAYIDIDVDLYVSSIQALTCYRDKSEKKGSAQLYERRSDARAK